MKLINVKKIPARSAGGESVPGGENAKYFKAFLIGDDLVPRCIQTETIKN